MSPEYSLTLDEEKFDVCVDKLDEGGLLIVKVGDESFTIKATLNEDGTWTVNDTAMDYDVKILRKAGPKVNLELNEEAKDVVWARVRKAQAIASTGVSSSGGPKISGGVYPPMPGKITEVKVAVGDSVTAGQTVCILEAMKMFNELKATSAGTIKEIHIEVGSSVTPDTLLLLIE
ncbi:MAG: biotin/lipoyl-containing protein [Candidatus Thorarchaeota archaeon]